MSDMAATEKTFSVLTVGRTNSTADDGRAVSDGITTKRPKLWADVLYCVDYRPATLQCRRATHQSSRAGSRAARGHTIRGKTHCLKLLCHFYSTYIIYKRVMRHVGRGLDTHAIAYHCHINKR